VLEASSVQIGVAIEGLGAREDVGDAGVEEEELGGRNRLAPPRFRPRRQEEPDQRVFEQVVVLADRGGRQPRIAPDRREVEHPPAGQRRRGQEPRELGQAADESLGLDLFLEMPRGLERVLVPLSPLEPLPSQRDRVGVVDLALRLEDREVEEMG
jgi:hypothetical protein